MEIFVVPHSHYDAVWIFDEEEYFNLNKLIIKKALELAEKNREFTFLLEQTHLLEKIKKEEPKLYEKIKKFVREGRMEIAGGEYLMPDLYLPQEETLIRSILIGRKFLEKEFGIKPKVMWQADSFGLPAQFPQICRKFGYKYIAFRRGGDRKKPSEFRWRALGGDEVIAHFMPFGYRAGLIPEKWEENIRVMKRLSACNKILFPCGSGTTLPDEELPELVKRWNLGHKEKMEFSLPSRFFKSIEKCRLEGRKGEMFSARYKELEVFPATASSRIWIKMALRRIERKILGLEKLISLLIISGKAKAKRKYKSLLDRLWKDVIFLSLHDVITGTCPDEIFEKIRKRSESVEMATEKVIKEIIENLGKRGEEHFVIFNPLSFPVREWVEVGLKFSKKKLRAIGKVISGNKKQEVELLEEERGKDGYLKKAKIGFIAELPPLTFKEYRISGEGKEIRRRITNRKFGIEILDGCRIKIYKDGKVICEGNEMVIEEEEGSLYRHSPSLPKILKSETGKGLRYGKFLCRDFKIRETEFRIIGSAILEYYALGWPYRGKIKERQVLKNKLLEMEKKVILYKNLPRIDFRVRIKNRHPGIRLRVKFCFREGKKFLSDTQFGWLERKKGIYPCLRWAGIEGKSYALALINFGTPEYEYDGRNVYLTLLRSVSKLSDGEEAPLIPTPDALELRDYEYLYSIYLTEESNPAIIQQAFIFNHKPFVFSGYRNVPRLPSFEISPGNLILSALKLSEDGKFIIARICEYFGKKCIARVRFPEKIKFSGFVDLNEEKLEEKRKVKVKAGELEFPVNPFEILTLRFKP